MLLITRPDKPGKTLYQAVLDKGIEAIYYPVLLIKPYQLNRPKIQHLIDNSDILLFTSPFAAKQFDQFRINNQLVFAIGQATATVLQQQHWPCHLIPKQANSEGLLAELSIDLIKTKRILIIKGQGGRELLATTLINWGGIITLLDVYQRELNHCPLPLNILSQIDSIHITSLEILQGLITNCPEQQLSLLKEKKLLLSSERLLEAAKAQGFIQFTRIKDASPQTLLEYLESLS